MTTRLGAAHRLAFCWKGEPMKIAVVCATYLRPETLGQMIACFEAQDYPAKYRQLVILDDAGQYDNQTGTGWRLVSVPHRFRSLGEKRNAAVGLVTRDAQAIAVWDDDDTYLPWALRATAAALRGAAWSRPGRVLQQHADGRYRQHETGGLYHGGWGYRLAAFHEVGGYPPINNGEDQGLAARFENAGIGAADPGALGFDPFYIYRDEATGYHLSRMGTRGYERLARRRVRRATVRIALPEGYGQIAISPGVLPRPF